MSHWVLSNQAKDIKPKLLKPKSIQYYFQHSTKNFLLESMAIFSQNINNLLLFFNSVAVYYPPETTTVSIYDKLKQHEPSIARCSFEFFARGQLLQELLEKASDPDMLLCDSLGVSSTDLKTFDDVIAGKLKEKAPEGFNLLKVAQERGWFGFYNCNKLVCRSILIRYVMK